MHIPERAQAIPRPITERITKETFNLVLCTGDLTDESTMKFLASLGYVQSVRGNMDFLKLPEEVKLKVEELTIGLIHGDTIYPRGDSRKLATIAQRMNVDILISGHTHRLSVQEVKVNNRKVLLLDPGSATGVWGGGPASYIPSFLILKIAENRVEIQTFQLRGSLLEEKILKFEK